MCTGILIVRALFATAALYGLAESTTVAYART